MFHAALWKLIRLQWRGGFHQFRRSLWTLRGLFHLGFMIVMLGCFMVQMYFTGTIASKSPQFLQTFGDGFQNIAAFGLFVFTGWTVLFSTGESTVYFTASEVAFLLPAPITRKQLLAYKLFKSFLGIVFLCLFMSLMFSARLGMWLSGFVGMVLTFTFLQLLTMNVAFVRQVLQEKVHVLLRRLFGYSVSIVVLVAVIQTTQQASSADFWTLVATFRQTPAGTWLLAPFQIFIRTILAPDIVSFLASASVVFVIDAVLLTIAFRLDALSLEAALATSEKWTARIKLMQTKGNWQLFGTPTSAVARRRLPLPPFWSGVGPIVWQKMMTTFRTSLKLLWMLVAAVLFAGAVVYGIHNSNARHPDAPIAGVVVMGYLSFLISLTQPNEIERVGYLKSLPIRTVAIVLGELLGFVVLLSAVQTTFILGLSCGYPDAAPWLVCGAVFTLPFNFLLFAIDKLVFYVYPARLAKGAPGDFQNAGRQLIFLTLKMLVLGLGFTIVGVVALPGALIYRSPLAALVPAAVLLVLECVGVVPLLTYAFDRFDPSVDTPA